MSERRDPRLESRAQRLVQMAQLSGAFAGLNLARAALGFAASVVVARGLGPAGFGHWTLWTAWAATLTMAFDCGLSTLVTRNAARADSDAGALVGGALTVRLVIFAPVAAAIVAMRSRFGSTIPPDAVSLIAGLAATGLAYGSLAALFRARPRWVPGILALETTGAAVMCAGAVVIVRRGGAATDLLAVAIVVQVAQFICAAIFWGRVARGAAFTWPTPRRGWELLRSAWPFALSGLIANGQARIAPLMLGALSSPGELAFFGVASRFADTVKLLPHASFAAALPVLARDGGRDPALRARVQGALRWFVLPAGAILCAGAFPILLLTYGPSYAAAWPVLAVAGAGLVPTVLNSARKVYLFAGGRERDAARWSLIALAVQAVGCGVAVPRFGAVGATVALLAGELLVWWPLRAASETPPADAANCQSGADPRAVVPAQG